MKKILSVLLALLVITTVFAGCGKPTEEETIVSTQPPKNVVVKILASSLTAEFSEEELYKTLDSIDGLTHTKDSQTNDYTLQMTESAYEKLKDIESKTVLEGFKEKEENTENYVIKIEHNEDFRFIRVTADREKMPEGFNFLDDVLVSIVADAMAYQLFTVDGQRVTVSVVAQDDGEELLKCTFPVIIE